MIFPKDPLVFVATAPVDLRLGVDKLACLVTEHFRKGVRDGAFFVFLNKRKNKLRILHYDKTGAWLLSKRLDSGTFPLPVSLDVDASHVGVSAEQLSLLLQGLGSRRTRSTPRRPLLH